MLGDNTLWGHVKYKNGKKKIYNDLQTKNKRRGEVALLLIYDLPKQQILTCYFILNRKKSNF